MGKITTMVPNVLSQVVSQSSTNNSTNANRSRNGSNVYLIRLDLIHFQNMDLIHIWITIQLELQVLL
jgi:hypothetical protein